MMRNTTTVAVEDLSGIQERELTSLAINNTASDESLRKLSIIQSIQSEKKLLSLENFHHMMDVFCQPGLLVAVTAIKGPNKEIAIAIVENQSLDQINRLLPDPKDKEACKQLHKCDELNNQLTFWAVAANRRDVLQHLVNHYHFGLSHKGVGKLTLIHLAILAKAYDVFHFLLMKEAREDKLILCHQNITSHVSELELHPFHTVILTGKANWLEAAFQRARSAHNIPWQVPGLGNSLHLAVLADQPVSFLFLLSKLGDEAKTYLETTTVHERLSVLSYAAALGRKDCLSLLLNFYRSNQSVREQRNEAYLIALCYAIEHKQCEAVDLLLLLGVSPDLMVRHGTEKFFMKTPFEIAKNCREEDDFIYNAIERATKKSLAREFKHPEIRFNKVENIVLQGGGVKGIAYVFGIRSLFDCIVKRAKSEDDTLLTAEEAQAGVVRYIGASAGAITAAFLAIGCTPDELMEELMAVDFNLFVEGLDTDKLLEKGILDKLKAIVDQLNVEPSLRHPLKTLHDLLDHQGLCSGKAFLHHMEDRLAFRLNQKVAQLKIKIDLISKTNTSGQSPVIEKLKIKLGRIEEIFAKKKEPKYLTLGELAQLVTIAPEMFKHLHTLATRLPSKEHGTEPKIVSFHSTQSLPRKEDTVSFEDVLVVDAVRASMSFPGVFDPYCVREMRQGEEAPKVYSPQIRYVDGGVLKNLPIEECDRLSCLFNLQPGDPEKVIINPDTLALSLRKEASTDKPHVEEEEPAAAETVPVQVSRLQAGRRSLVRFIHQSLDKLKQLSPKTLIAQAVTEKMSKETKKLIKSEAAQLIGALIACYEEAETMLADYQSTRKGRVIEIGDRGVNTLNFNITPDDIRHLSESAIESVYSHFGFPPSQDIKDQLKKTFEHQQQEAPSSNPQSSASIQGQHRDHVSARVAASGGGFISSQTAPHAGLSSAGSKKIKNVDQILSSPMLNGLQLSEVPRDGHCLFNAVGIYLGKSPKELRTEVAKYLKKQRKEFKEVIEESGLSREKYIDRLIEKPEWGGALEIEVMQRIEKRPIIIIRPNGANPTFPDNLEDYKKDPIFVYYDGKVHYDALILKAGADPNEILARIKRYLQQGNKSETQFDEHSPNLAKGGVIDTVDEEESAGPLTSGALSPKKQVP